MEDGKLFVAVTKYIWDGQRYVSCDLAYAEDTHDALHKVMVMHGKFVQVSSIELTVIDDELINMLKTIKGGTTLVTSERE